MENCTLTPPVIRQVCKSSIMFVFFWQWMTVGDCPACGLLTDAQNRKYVPADEGD